MITRVEFDREMAERDNRHNEWVVEIDSELHDIRTRIRRTTLKLDRLADKVNELVDLVNVAVDSVSDHVRAKHTS